MSSGFSEFHLSSRKHHITQTASICNERLETAARKTSAVQWE